MLTGRFRDVYYEFGLITSARLPDFSCLFTRRRFSITSGVVGTLCGGSYDKDLLASALHRTNSCEKFGTVSIAVTNQFSNRTATSCTSQ